MSPRPTSCGVRTLVPLLLVSPLAGNRYVCLGCGRPVRSAGGVYWRHTRGEQFAGRTPKPVDFSAT